MTAAGSEAAGPGRWRHSGPSFAGAAVGRRAGVTCPQPGARGSRIGVPSLWLPIWLLSHGAAAWAAIGVETDEPRTFGYTVGEVVQRRVVLHVPAGLVLDEDSLPPIGRQGRALELRSIGRRVLGDAAGQPGVRDHEIRLAYQVFVSPPEVRTFEMPPLVLRFRGRPRDEDVRIDAWPLVVAPLVAVDVSPRRGLGAWQPDAPPPLIDTAPGLQRLAVYGALLALLLGAWLAVQVVAPWLGRQRRPFERCWRALRAALPLRTADQRRDAFRHLHAALNQTAGQVLFAGGVDRFTAAHPPFAPLRVELAAFFSRSQQAFFAVAAAGGRSGAAAGVDGGGSAACDVPSRRTVGESGASGDNTDTDTDDDDGGAWLLAFCLRCRDIERGTA